MKYLVGCSDVEFGEQDFAIIEASTESEATLAFVRQIATHESGFQENVYERSVNMSFAERFWLETWPENETFMNSGEITATEDDFRQRVQAFFAPHNDYAELCLTHYFHPDRFADPLPGAVQFAEPPFPEDMLLFIWLNYDYCRLTTMALSEVQEIFA